MQTYFKYLTIHRNGKLKIWYWLPPRSKGGKRMKFKNYIKEDLNIFVVLFLKQRVSTCNLFSILFLVCVIYLIIIKKNYDLLK